MGVMDRYKNSNKNKENSSENVTPKLGVRERYEASKVTSTQPSKETTFTLSEEGKTGWQKYLDDQEAKANAPKYDVNNNGKDDWWEKVIGWLGEGSVDTTLPTAGVTQTINDLRADESYRRPTTDWTDEQRDAFGKLYLESPTTAYNFAEETNKTIKEAKEKAETEKIQDSATSSFGAGLGHTIGAIATAPFGAADFLYDLALSNAGREIAPDGYITPFEYSQAVTGGISQDLNEKYGTLDEDIPIIGGKGWGDAYGLGTSIAQSAASGLTLGGAGTLVSYFGQGAASGIDEALSRGASETQAVLYGVALGTFEGVAEMIGIDNLFKIGSSATVKEAIKNVLKQAGAEGMEEGLTSILSNIADNAIMQDKSSFNLRVTELMAEGVSEEEAKKKAWLESIGDIAFDVLGGAVSGGVHAGVSTGIQTTVNNAQNQKYFGDQAEAMVNEAVASGDASVKAVGEKYQQKLSDNKKLSGWNITELVEVTDAAKVKSAVEAKLTEYGETGDVSAIADVLVKQAQGYDLTMREKKLLKESSKGSLVATEMDADKIKGGGLENKWAENIGTRTLNADVYNKAAYDLAKEVSGLREAAEKNAAAESEADIKNEAGAKFEASADGKTTYTDAQGNVRDVAIKKIASTEGEIKVELDDGTVVKASDLSFSTKEEALMYEMVARMEVTPETANEIIGSFKPSNVGQASKFFTAVPLAYQYGKMGYEAGLKNIDMNDSLKKIVYNRGRMDAVAQDKVKTEKGGVKGATKKDGIIYEGGYVYDESSASDIQKASMAGIEVINKMSNLEVHVFESIVKDGERVYRVDGEYVKAPNGYFVDGNKIYIDINAGNGGEGAMLYTAAHEIAHYIREWNAKGFREIGDFLIKEYGKQGVPVQALLNEQKEKIKKRYERENKALPSEAKLADMAYEELVADAMSEMLADERAYEKLAKLKQKDRTLWQKLGEAIKAVLDKLKGALGIYSKLSPDAQEAAFVRGFDKKTFEKLQDLYLKAFVEADNNFSTAEKTLADNGIVVNPDTNSASLLSVRDTLNDEQRKKVSKALAIRFGVTQDEAMEWLKAETSMASLILNPKYSQYLDYTPDPNEVAIKQNSDYPQGTVDFSPICAKRREFTSVMNNILRLFPNHVFAATDLAKIRSIMQEEGMTIPCGICYVEDRRQLDTIVAQNFIDSLKLYREGSETRPDGKPFNTNQLKGLSLIDGDNYTPSVYELVSLEGLNVLKEKNPNMAEAWVKFNNARGMQSVRLLANEAEYKRQILNYTKKTVQSKNDKGGLRVYSFSDAEMFHLIDIIQVITDSATVGLYLQGYTKVNEYARAVKDTGEKLNRSLIPKGELGYHIEDGKVVLDYDTVEGIDINHPDFFDNKDNPNVGNITIGINDIQIRAAMVSDFVDQIIPFHTGQSEEVLGEKGISTWDNYKDFQTEKDIATGKVSEHQINIYTEVLQELEKEGKTITKRTFVEKFLQVCKDNGLTPRFSQFLNTNAKGEYVYTEGYHKMLVDFKTFAQTEVGEYLPQGAVKPIFDNEYITKILKDYVKSQKVKDGEIAKSMPKVIDRITNEIVKPGETKYSDRNIQPITDEEYKALKKHFGTTGNFKVAGYLLPDGNLLDFSGKHWGDTTSRSRQVDHRDASEVLDRGDNGINDMIDMIGSGSIRLMPETGGINLAVYPNEKQRRVLSAYINYMLATEGQVIIDYDAVGGDTVYSRVYEKYSSSRQILSDIRNYFNGARQSDLMSFHTKYSDRDSYSEGLSEADKAIAEKVISGLKTHAGVARYGIRSMGAYTDERIDREIRTSSSDTVLDYAKSYITWVEPIDFIYATTTSEKVRDVLREEAGDLDLDRLRNETQPIHLTVNFETGEIVGHEGRHRMLALQKAGVDRVAVVIDALNDDRHHTKPIEFKQLKGQRFGQYAQGVGFSLHDVLPLSKRYAGVASKLFAIEPKGGVRFSDRDSYAPTFYSHMGKVIDDVKFEKMGASSILNHLKNRGVKDEEIKWSGIETFLEGKKSVTKAELQEFIAGSQLQIVEDILDNEDQPYTEDQKKRLGEYKAKQDEVTKRVADEWKKITGKDLPINIRNAATESGVVNAIIDANKEHKDASFEGRLLKKLDKDLREVIENNDYFGFDSVDDALLSIHRHRRDFIKNIDASTKDKAVIVKYCNALNAYNELSNMISDKDTDRLRAIAREGDQYSRKIAEVMREYDEEQELHMTKWDQYTLKGGKNYRELLFKMPDSTYSNDAMYAHWDERSGVMAHARVQDFDVNGKKMLFIEEIQSDWHNEGAKRGYGNVSEEERAKAADAVYKAAQKVRELEAEFRNTPSLYDLNAIVKAAENGQRIEDLMNAYTDVQGRLSSARHELAEAEEASDELDRRLSTLVPDAPFRENYHEYVLKRLLRMAAEEGYDSIGWTPSEIQSERWSKEFEKAYRIEYDQEMPKFLRKYGKKWGATVGTATVSDTEVWSMDITDSMKQSVLYEGQVLYSERVTDKKTLDFLNEQLKNGEVTEVYRAMTVDDEENLYPPMAGYVRKNGKKIINGYPSVIGEWEQSTESIKWESVDEEFLIENGFKHFEKPTKDYPNGRFEKDNTIFYKNRQGEWKAKFHLDKDNGATVDAAYAPYIHTSLSVLNDQFTSAYTRENLVVVKGYVPNSEVYGVNGKRYQANFADKPVGKTKWHSGVVAAQMPETRTVILSRYFMPIEIVDDAVMAQKTKEMMQGKDIEIPYNVVTPRQRRAMEAIGIRIGEARGLKDAPKKADVKYSERDPNAVSNRTLLAGALESVAQNEIEKKKLDQYKEKIALIESEQKKLGEIRAKANELRFTKGRTSAETKQMKDLDFEANQIANRINTYDKQLLNLESTTALKNVLDREKANLRKRLEQKSKQALKDQKQKDAETIRELMNRHTESRKKAIEGRHKTEVRNKIKKVVSDLNKLLLNPTKDQHVPIDLQLPVAEALDAINMDTMNAEERVAYYNDLISKTSDPDKIELLTKKRDFFEYRDANFKERIAALKNAYAEFKESDDPLIRNAHNEAIEDLIKNTADAVGNKSLKDMSYEQLEAVYNMYKAILATIRNSNKMFKEGRQETVTENSEAVKAQVKEIGGHQDRVLKLSKFFKKFGWDMLKPVTAMKVIGSKTFEKLFDNVRAGEDTWAVDVGEAKEFYKAVAEKYGYKKWDFKKRFTFKDSVGKEFSISLEQIMSLYAYSKRNQADKHLEIGGFIFDDAIEVTEKKLGIPLKYEVNDANPYRLGKEHILSITEALTKEQKAFIDEMQTYLSDVMGAKGNEVSLAMYDIKLYNEKNYFPLKTSRYFREFDPEKSGTPRIKNSGFSKKTVPQAGNPIVLSNFMDVWAGHVNDMSMYHAFVLPLEDFMRVYNYSSTAGGYDSVQQYIKNAYGAQANQYIERLMDDLNGGARVDSSAGVINKGLSLFKKASVFASASVVVQQPSAIGRAFAYINPKYFVGISKAKHKELWAEVKKYAPVAVIKEMGYFDTGMGRSTVEWIKGDQTIKDKMDDVLSKAPALADEYSWCAIWDAVKRETASNHKNLSPQSEEFLKICGDRFTEVITNTQVYDSVLSRSGMMRSKDTGMKMATAFMAEPTTTVNMMVDGIIQGKRGNKKFTAATVGAVSSSIILNSILVALVYAARDDDEDETYAEKYVGSVTSELLDGFNPLTYVPFVKDIWSIAQGYDVERSDMSVVSKLWESIEGLFKEDKSGLDKVLDVTGSVSSLFGIPLKNIIRDAKGMYNLTLTLTSGTQTTGAGIGEAVEDSFKSAIPLWDRLTEDKSNSDRLYEAILSGDKVQIGRVKSHYKDENAIESAIRQALRENDPRIKEAAKARYEGDISEYTRIAKQIIAEGKFSQDTIVAAINAELNAIKKGETVDVEETEAIDEVTSIYKASDINTAFDSGDTDMALEIINDLIETKVANGMEEKNARSSLRSSMTSYWKPLYKAAYQNGDTNEMYRIRTILLSSGLYGSADDVIKTAQDWLKS